MQFLLVRFLLVQLLVLQFLLGAVCGGVVLLVYLSVTVSGRSSLCLFYLLDRKEAKGPRPSWTSSLGLKVADGSWLLFTSFSTYTRLCGIPTMEQR